MPSPPDFVNLPTEVVEAITVPLDFSDKCSLRLSAREVAAKAFHGPFKTCFTTKSFDISREDLQRCEAATRPVGFGCAIEHLTVVGIVPTSEEEWHSQQQRSDALTRCFTRALSRLRAQSKFVDSRSILSYTEGTLRLVALQLYYQVGWNLGVRGRHGSLGDASNLSVRCTIPGSRSLRLHRTLCSESLQAAESSRHS